MSGRGRNLSLARLLIPNLTTLPRLDNFKLEEVPGAFVNLTSYEVSSQMAALLSYGPRFLLPTQASAIDYIEDFGQLHNYLFNRYGNLDPTQVFLELFNRHQQELEELFAGQQLSIVEVALREASQEVHQFFQTYPDVCIVQADKGNRTCLMLRSDYEFKMKAYIDKCISTGVYVVATPTCIRLAKAGYSQLKYELLKAPEARLHREQIPEQLLRNFTTTVPSKSELPHLYGTVKSHKEGAPMRPICSTVKWLSRPVQQLLLHTLKTCFNGALCTQNVDRVDEVARQLSTFPLRPGHVFVKMDIVNMYGTLPKDKIGNMLRRLLQNPIVQQRLPMSAQLVERLFNYSMQTSCLVTYGDVVYRQVQGLPQGACDSGFLATLYLDTLLQVHSEELFKTHHVRGWWKYMDDLLLYMPSRYVNSFKHTFERIMELKLEVDNEEDVGEHPLAEYGVVKTISFLDLSISTTRQRTLLTSRYTKPTASTRMIHALSTTIYSYKLNAIKGFLLRIFRRTSTALLMHDMNTFYEQALHNGYPPSLLGHIYHEAITQEIGRLQSGNSYLTLTRSQLRDRVELLKAIMPDRYELSPEVIENIRERHVALSPASRCVFPYRSVDMSHLIEMGCAYGGVRIPVYSRADQSGLFSRYFANRSMVRLVGRVNADSRRIQVGFVTCTNCGLVFIISGFHNLEHLLDSELDRSTSVLHMHQETFGHIISPVVRALRPIRGVDASYLNTIYAAIFTSLGVSCSNPFVLQQVPIYIRGLLGYMQGLGDFSETPRLLSPEVSLLLQDSGGGGGAGINGDGTEGDSAEDGAANGGSTGTEGDSAEDGTAIDGSAVRDGAEGGGTSSDGAENAAERNGVVVGVTDGDGAKNGGTDGIMVCGAEGAGTNSAPGDNISDGTAPCIPPEEEEDDRSFALDDFLGAADDELFLDLGDEVSTDDGPVFEDGMSADDELFLNLGDVVSALGEFPEAGDRRE